MYWLVDVSVFEVGVVERVAAISGVLKFPQVAVALARVRVAR